MKSIEVSARTIEEAVSDGLTKLGCSIADCRVEVLQEGAKGLFGVFGSKPAMVRLTLVSDGDDLDDFSFDLNTSLRQEEPPSRQPEKRPPQQKKKPEPRPAQERQPTQQARKQQAQQRDRHDEPEKKAEPEKRSEPGKNERNDKNRMRIASTPQVIDKPKSNNVLERFKSAPLPGSDVAHGNGKAGMEQHREPLQAARPSGGRSKQRDAAPRTRVPREDREAHEEAYDVESVDRTPVPAPDHIEMHDPATPQGIVQRFLLELTHRMGVDVQVDVHTGDDGHLFASMYGDTIGILIGRRGETLDALQYLTSLQVNKGREEYLRVTLDTENYRAKREEALNRLAARVANRAVKTGRKVSLEPMNPYERRILHSSLQDNPNVTTHSEGDEPYRHVVVVPQR